MKTYAHIESCTLMFEATMIAKHWKKPKHLLVNKNELLLIKE